MRSRGQAGLRPAEGGLAAVTKQQLPKGKSGSGLSWAKGELGSGLCALLGWSAREE
jgi:hypothetical protein